MQAPEANQVRILKIAVARSHAARQALAAIEPVLMALALGGGGDAASELVERLRREWPDLDLGGETYVSLSSARTHLSREVAAGDRASRALHQAVEQQWQALGGEGFEGLREELTDLIDQRAGLAARIQPVEATLARMRPLLAVLADQQAALREDVSEGTVQTLSRAHARIRYLLDAVRNALDGTNFTHDEIDLSGGALPVAVRDQTQALDGLMELLHEAIARLAAEHAELHARIRAVDASIEERTG